MLEARPRRDAIIGGVVQLQQPQLAAVAIGPGEIDLTVSYSGPPAAALYSFYRSLNPQGPYVLLAQQASNFYEDLAVFLGQTFYYEASVTTAEISPRTTSLSSVVSATPFSVGIYITTDGGTNITTDGGVPITIDVSAAPPSGAWTIDTTAFTIDTTAQTIDQ